MDLSKKLKQLTAVGIVVVSALLLLFIFFATQTALELWDRLQSAPAALFYGYLIFVGLIVGAVIWAIIKLLLPAKKRKDGAKNIDKESILQELDDAESDGMETERLRHELDILQQRKEAGTIHIALFGDVSTGKSSIIKALLPDANIETHIKGGSTQDITEYTWRSQSGDKLLLTDLPGRNEATGELDEMAQDEAVRAQVVIYVTDSDLTRSQFADVVTLQSYGKPLLLAINKSDRFNDEEKALIKGRIEEHFDSKLKVSFITSGGMEEVTKVYPDGRE
ncbi:MAG TPA: GTP-binding protein, partial [Thiothrix sp.]|nr:GTP-binding protein [Thiothrix sp.]